MQDDVLSGFMIGVIITLGIVFPILLMGYFSF